MSSKIIKSSAITSGNSNYLTNNLRYLMQKKSIDTAELSDSTGIALTTINNLKRGVGNPTLSTLKILSEFFQVTIGQLTESALSNSTTKTTLMDLPLLDIQDVQAFLSGDIRSTSTITIEVETNNQLFAVKINNNSLTPLFEKGTIFVVNPTLSPQDGDLVLIKFNNHPFCFRKVFIEDESYIFCPVSDIIGSEASKSKNFTICGIVIKAIQNFYE